MARPLLFTVSLLVLCCTQTDQARNPGPPFPVTSTPPAACQGVTPPLPDGTVLKPLSTPQPSAPRGGSSRRGYACASVTIDESGRVKEPLLVSASDPEFGRALLRVLPQWRFAPIAVDGQPISVRTTFTSHFVIP
jgi:TonB family protein